MPVYAYACNSCKQIHELRHSMTTIFTDPCPSCKSEGSLEKLSTYYDNRNVGSTSEEEEKTIKAIRSAIEQMRDELNKHKKELKR